MIRSADDGFLRRLRSQRWTVADASMAPTLSDGDRVLVDPRAYTERPPEVGDVVALDDPEDPDRGLVKRVAVVGPGVLSLPVDGLRPGEGPLVPVLAGTVYVLSDDPKGRDSRRFGPVPLRALRGQVWYRTGPADARGPIGRGRPTP